jgi:hypothetical protein
MSPAPPKLPVLNIELYQEVLVTVMTPLPVLTAESAALIKDE